MKSATFSPDGARIVTASGDRTARVWEAATGTEIAALRGHKGWVHSAAFSPDGARIVTASGDRTARIWDAATGAEIAALRGHEGAVAERRLLARRRPRRHRLLRPHGAGLGRRDGAEIAALRGHEGWLKSAAFSPDGARVVTASRDNTARIWDAATGQEIAALRGHQGWVKSAAFSPDGVRIVTASDGPHGADLGRGDRAGDRRPARPRGRGGERRVLARRRPHRHRLMRTARRGSGMRRRGARSPR